jgi:hypothetical protein
MFTFDSVNNMNDEFIFVLVARLPDMTSNKLQPVWRPLSPTRPIDTNDPTPQEAITFKTQEKPIESTSHFTNDRRQTAPVERKSRYATHTNPINTASIPPLMSVRSDVPPSTSSTAMNSKHFKTSNYSQRHDFYNDTNDSTWPNEDEYYEDETGYYDSNMSNHARHAYQSHSHHRGYTTLGSYGRYRRGGALRHQQQYTTYAPSSTVTQLNTSTGSKSKKTSTNRSATTTAAAKKVNETVESSTMPVDEPIRKSSAWTNENRSTVVEEIPTTTKSHDTSTQSHEIESNTKDVSEPKPLLANDINVNINSTDTLMTVNKKSTASTGTSKKNNQDQHFPTQQASRHRNTYGRSMQGTISLFVIFSLLCA